MDGYEKHLDFFKRLEDMKDLFSEQSQINEEISKIDKELETLPEVPLNIDHWISSLPDITSYNFTLSDYKKVMKISKIYKDLADKRVDNLHKIKVIVIDSLIDKINEILEK